MSLREIIKYPNDLIHKKCKSVEKITEDIKLLISDMIDTLKQNNAIGISAPQLGVLKEIIVIDIVNMTKGPVVMINPQLVELGGAKALSNEGCLSLPGVFENVERLTRIAVKFLNECGEEKELDFTGLAAFCVQHELDHLRGKLFIDNLSVLKRSRLLKKYGKQQKKEQRNGVHL